MKSKEIRREEAILRQNNRDKLSPQQQLKIIKERRGNSDKEIQRLQKQIKDSK